MNRKDFLLLASGGLLVSACEKSAVNPVSPAPSQPGSTPGAVYLSADLSQELLSVGSTKQSATPAVWVQRIAVGNTANAFRHFSLLCTHAGCIVAPQAANAEFHCPCHGSKFTATGTVLEGPATRPLEQHVLTVNGTTLLIKGS